MNSSPPIPPLRGRSRLILLARCIGWAWLATLALLFAGYAPPNLYQGF